MGVYKLMAVLNLARVIKDPEIVSTGNKQHKYRIIVSIPDVKNPTDIWKIVGFETSSPDFKNVNNESWVAISVDPTRSVKVGETVDKFPIYRVDGKATQIISLDKQPELVRQILESERGSQLRIALENRDRQDQAQLLNPNNPIPPIGIDPVKNQEGNPLVHVNDLLSKTDSLHRQITDDFKYRKAGALPTEEPILGIVPIPYPDSLYDPFTPGYIRIGHVPFTLSPEMIQIDREASMVSVPALRSKGSGKRGRGHYITRVDFQLRFCSEQEIVDTLLPLLRMIRKTPFLPVYNYYLNDLNDIQAISVSNISLQTVQGLPNVIECSITSYAFNWHHYLHNDISFEDTICYPLLKMWCESSKSDVSEFNVSGGFPNWPVKVDRGNKPLRDHSKKLIPEAMNGKITFFLPNEESLKKYESTLKEEEIQTAENRGRIIDGNTAQSLTQVIDRSKDDSQADQLFGYYNPKDSQNNSIEGTALVRKNQSIGYLPQLSYHNGGRDNDGPVLVVKTERPEQVIKLLSLDKNVMAVGGDANITQTYYGSLDNNKNKTYIRSLKNPLPNPQGYFAGTEMDGGKTQDGLYMEMVALEDQKAGRPIPKAPTANPGDYVFIIPIPSITALKGTKNKKGEHAVRVFLDQMIAGSTLHKNPYHQRTFSDLQPKSAAEGMKATAYTTEPSYTHLTFDEFPVDIVVESIQGGYANILTDHQVQLDEIPAHQYLGSTDIMLQVSCTVFSDSALSNIKDLFSKVEQLARRYNGSIYSTTPFGGFMKIDNEIFGLLGVKHVIPQRIRSATIPGFPNTHRVEMEFIEYDPTQRNREKLNRLEDPSWFSNSGFDQQSHRSGFGEATIKSNLLQEKLRTLELYPDMELPLISEVNEWIKIIQEGKDSVLERFPWMAGWEWTDSKDSGAIASLVPADFKRSQFKEDLENVSTTISNYLFGHGSLGSSGSISSFISESLGKFPLHDRFVDPDFYCIPSINTKDEIEKTLEDLAGQTTKLTSTFIGDSGDFRFPAYNSDGTLKDNTGHITPDISNPLTTQYLKDFGDMKNYLWMYEGDEGSGDNNTTNNTNNKSIPSSGSKLEPLPEIPAVPDNPGGPVAPANPGNIPKATKESKNQEEKSTGASPSFNQAAAVIGSLVQETARRVSNGVKNKIGNPPSDAWTQNLKLELARWYSAVIDLETGGSWLHVNPNGKVKGTNKTIEEWKNSSDRSSFGLGVGIAQVVPSVWYNTMPGGGDQIYTSWSANLRKGYEIWSNPTKGPRGRNPGPIEKQIVNNYNAKNPNQYDLGNILSFSTQSYIGWGKADKNGVNHNTYLNYVVSLMGSDDAASKLNASQQAETKKRRPELFQKLQVILGVSEQDINLANLDASNVTNPNLYNVSTGKFSELRRHPPQAAEQIPNMLHDMKIYSPRGRLLLAFPTHCVLLVDGGNWIRWRKLYDHFYGMSAVSEINIHTPAYRESPVQVAKITFNNLHGSLSTQKAEIERLKSADTRNNWGWSDIFGGIELALDPTNDWMIQQRWRHHIDSLMMKPGVRIHVRLGYGASAVDLPVCFNGRVTDVPVSEGELSVIALGDGVELINQLDSNAVSYGKEVWSDTPGIFGKGGEPRDIILSFFTEPKGKFLNAVSRGAFGSENAYGIQNFGYYHQAFPWHDGGEMGINVYNSGDHREYLNKSSPLWNWFDVLNLKGWNTGQAILGIQMEDANPWKAIEVCRSVVPDYETAVVPFEFRSTLFYGATWYPLFYKYRPEAINQDGTLKNPSFMTDGPGTLTDRSLTNMEDYFEIWEHKPFQQIHVYSSIANIIDNQIRADESRVRNECIGVGIYNGWLTMDRNEKSLKMQADWNIFPELKKLELYNTGVYSTTLQKLNDANSQRIGEARNTDINRGSALEQRFGIPLLENIAEWVTSRLSSIFNPVFSRKILDFAATTRLVDRLRDMYQGNLVVYGDPSVKPRDLCYLGDSYNSMDGVFEVKAVTHFLSLDTGFITTIEPDCCVAAADTWRYETWTAAQMIGARFIAGEASRYIYAKLAAGLHPLKVARAISQWLKNSGSVGKASAQKFAANLAAGEKSGVYYEKVNGIYNSLTEFTGSTIEKVPGSEKGIGALKSVYEFLKGGSKSIDVAKSTTVGTWARLNIPGGNPLTDLLESEAGQSSLKFMDFLKASKAAKTAGSELSTLESLGALGSDLFVLGSRVARFGAILFIIPAATELVTRYLASVHSCVIMPLRLGGKEFSAGITGHLGLVRGDPVSSIDNAILGYTNASYADRYGTATQSVISRIFNMLGVQTTDFHGEIQPETDPALLSKWKEEMIGKAAAIKGGDSYSTADQTFSNTGLSSTSASQPIVNSKVAWPLYNSKGKPIGTNPGDRSVHIPNTGFTALRNGHLHAGWDFGAPIGTPIYPVAMGTVIYSSPDSRGSLGYHTIVDHGGWYSGYHHMQSPGPPKGTIVTPGSSILGKVGLTGNTTGPHLHLSIFDNNYFYDPVPILQNGKFDPTIADRSPLWGSYKEIIKNK
jgi:murein DD-endopeptidase MepM/ murein hydrolase activator NlpD